MPHNVIQRVSAFLALALLAAFAVLLVVNALVDFPRGLIAAALTVLALLAFWLGALRRGSLRTALLVLGGVLLVGGLVTVLLGGVLPESIVLVGLVVLILAAARRAFATRVTLPSAEQPRAPVVVWNPKSGGGKAPRAGLAEEARTRGIEPIELRPGDDLEQLVRDAVARGADGLAAAGGDGTQALVATIAAEHGLPFACIPAGTRNHFALDLGVDRNDLIGALDAFVDGGEHVVDLGDINGRVFVNNASLGLYAEAVQREGYREAKLRTIMDTAPEFLGDQEGGGHELRWTDSEGTRHRSAAVILVSNNEYRLGNTLGSGTRPRIDDGLLGIAVMSSRRGGHGHLRTSWRQWSAAEFTVDSDEPLPVGVDGEALVLDPPLRFRIRPGALRVRIAPQHPGASPSAAQPYGTRDFILTLARIAGGADPAHLRERARRAAP